jgi:hypothetical protein
MSRKAVAGVRMTFISSAQFRIFSQFLILPLQDCDFPEDIRVPEIRPESHPEEINVMEFLKIKRAKSVVREEQESKE